MAAAHLNIIHKHNHNVTSAIGSWCVSVQATMKIDCHSTVFDMKMIWMSGRHAKPAHWAGSYNKISSNCVFCSWRTKRFWKDSLLNAWLHSSDVPSFRVKSVVDVGSSIKNKSEIIWGLQNWNHTLNSNANKAQQAAEFSETNLNHNFPAVFYSAIIPLSKKALSQHCLMSDIKLSDICLERLIFSPFFIGCVLGHYNPTTRNMETSPKPVQNPSETNTTWRDCHYSTVWVFPTHINKRITQNLPPAGGAEIYSVVPFFFLKHTQWQQFQATGNTVEITRFMLHASTISYKWILEVKWAEKERQGPWCHSDRL